MQVNNKAFNAILIMKKKTREKKLMNIQPEPSIGSWFKSQPLDTELQARFLEVANALLKIS